MRISKITRRDITDAIITESFSWSGRLGESEFLSRLFDLGSLPSTDGRFRNADGDIWQHRVNNPFDWDDYWVFHDDRFNLMGCEDDLFLRFLCETIHPVTRQDVTEAERICHLYNSFLKNDGFELVEKTRLSGKPVFIGRYVGLLPSPGVNIVKDVLSGLDTSYVSQQITRMETSVMSDPGLAIGTAKELVETCCKTILNERGVEIPKNTELSQLIKLTSKELQLTPDDIPEQAKASETIKRLLGNLAAITQGVAELRNQYGTGHGKHAHSKGLTSRHAKLAVGVRVHIGSFSGRNSSS